MKPPTACALWRARALDFPEIEVSGPANEDGLYEVPVALVARQLIPNDPLRGTFYSGDITLRVVGLPEGARTIDFNFRSPTPYQRYLAPFLNPVYSMPWGLCTWPLTLFLLLALIARFRRRDFEDDEWEEAAVATVSQVQYEPLTAESPTPSNTTENSSASQSPAPQVALAARIRCALGQWFMGRQAATSHAAARAQAGTKTARPTQLRPKTDKIPQTARAIRGRVDGETMGNC